VLAAQDDVREIHAYIARESRAAVAAMVRRIRSESARLARYPEIGRAVSEYDNPEYGERIIGPYRLIYRYRQEANLVRVLAVIHGSRTLPSVRSRE